MSLKDLKFAEGEFAGRDIASLDDRPKLSAAELKAYFDNVSKNMLALGRFNDLIDELLAGGVAEDIMVTLPGGEAAEKLADVLARCFAELAAHNADGEAHADIRELVGTSVTAHNTDSEAHADIRKLVGTSVAAHNTDSEAHADIRELVQENAQNIQIVDRKIPDGANIALHNTDGEAHADIRQLAANAVGAHNENSEAHADIRQLVANTVAAHNKNGEAHADIRELVQANTDALAAHNTDGGAHADVRQWMQENADALAALEQKVSSADNIESHNQSGEAHSDIRAVLEKLQSAITALESTASTLQSKSKVWLQIYAPSGALVRLYRNGSFVKSTTMGSDMHLKLEVSEIGSWELQYRYNNVEYTKAVEVNAVGMTTVAAPPTLEAAPWEFIDKVSTAGLADQCWKIGDTKSVSLSGTAVTVRILDFYHDLLEEPGLGNGKSTRAGITFALTDTLSDKVKMHSVSAVTAWADRDMITTVLPGKLAGLPTALQNVIKTVNKVMMIPEIVSEAGSTSGGTNLTAQGAEFMASQLFLLSERELFGEGRVSTPYYSFEDQYEYFRRCNSPCASQDYWLRSQLWTSNIAGQYASVLVSSGQIYSRTLQYEYGLLFGFCV